MRPIESALYIAPRGGGHRLPQRQYRALLNAFCDGVESMQRAASGVLGSRFGLDAREVLEALSFDLGAPQAGSLVFPVHATYTELPRPLLSRPGPGLAKVFWRSSFRAVACAAAGAPHVLPVPLVAVERFAEVGQIAADLDAVASVAQRREGDTAWAPVFDLSQHREAFQAHVARKRAAASRVLEMQLVGRLDEPSHHNKNFRVRTAKGTYVVGMPGSLAAEVRRAWGADVIVDARVTLGPDGALSAFQAVGLRRVSSPNDAPPPSPALQRAFGSAEADEYFASLRPRDDEPS